MSDILGKTVTEYALERRIAELEFENQELRHSLPPSISYKEIPIDKEISMDNLHKGTPLRETLHLATYASGVQRGMGYSIIARAYNLSKGSFEVGHYLNDKSMSSMGDLGRMDYLQYVFQDVAQSIAAKVYARK